MNEETGKEPPKPSDGEGSVDPVWSILPSYYMYSNTINTGINDRRPDPPTYDLSSRPSLNSTNTNSSLGQLSDVSGTIGNVSSSPTSANSANAQTSTSYAQTSEEYNDQDAHIKENLLDNIHKLKNLTSVGNKHADALELSIVFTKETGVGNKPSTIIDPTNYEFSQGDYINGYVLIKNNSPVPVSFDMFYFVLEGEFKSVKNVNAMKPTVTVKTFLQMFDFNASYNAADINRLVSYDPSACNTIVIDNTTYEYDPSDKTVHWLVNRMVHPNISYKRFFTFKFPNKLLDSTCQDSGLSAHVSLPPTFGGSKVKDFSTINSSVKYGVSARFIGRHSKYNSSVSTADDEFVVLKDASQSFCVIPYSTSESEYELVKIEHNEFFKSIKERISEGESLVNPQKESLSPVQSSDMLARIEKSISQNTRRQEKEPLYEFYIPLYRASAFSKLSLSNTLRLKTPRIAYTIAYIPPERFRRSKSQGSSSWKLSVPFEISINTGGSNKSVDIKAVAAELVVLTLESQKYSLPVELHHDLIFNQFKPNKTPQNLIQDEDTLYNNFILQSKNLNLKISDMIDKTASAGVDWTIDARKVHGVKALSEMSCKTINLNIRKTGVFTGGMAKDIKDVEWKHSEGRKTKSFDLNLDLTTAVVKSDSKKDLTDSPAYDKFTLVPNFQSCNVCRMYYLSVIFRLSNGQNVYVKLPLNVERF